MLSMRFFACISLAYSAKIDAMQPELHELAVIKSFITNDKKRIDAIRTVMDEIEENQLGYNDYSKRTGLIWSDVLVNTTNGEIITEFDTTKVTLVGDEIRQQSPQSIMSYSAVRAIISRDVLPKMFAQVGKWRKLPEHVFAQIFLQRCSSSDAMDWHQDPGEEFDPQANYSLVLMLSDSNDPDFGWTGGEFMIRSGLPQDSFDPKHVTTIVPRYNQAILFNNKINCHATTEVSPNMLTAKRDIIVILFNVDQMPQLK